MTLHLSPNTPRGSGGGTPPASPYLAPGFYDKALAAGRHRDIVGGRWDETGRAQMALLIARGLKPQHRLLDIGAGALRLGCKAVPYLDPGQYWATDASLALMQRGRAVELADPVRLPESNLVEDADFRFPGIPQPDFAIAFGVFTHLPAADLGRALASLAHRWPRMPLTLFTVFLAPASHSGPLRQPDGVVTHPDRPPWHMTEAQVRSLAAAAGLTLARQPDRLPRGQVLWLAEIASTTRPLPAAEVE